MYLSYGAITASYEPFPRIGFQITKEPNSTDDLPSKEENRLNPMARTLVFFRENTTGHLGRDSFSAASRSMSLDRICGLPAVILRRTSCSGGPVHRCSGCGGRRREPCSSRRE